MLVGLRAQVLAGGRDGVSEGSEIIVRNRVRAFTAKYDVSSAVVLHLGIVVPEAAVEGVGVPTRGIGYVVVTPLALQSVAAIFTVYGVSSSTAADAIAPTITGDGVGASQAPDYVGFERAGDRVGLGIAPLQSPPVGG